MARLGSRILFPPDSTIPRSAQNTLRWRIQSAPNTSLRPTPKRWKPCTRLARTEGIIPALESSHAVAECIKRAPKMKKSEIVIVNISGRGDKDMGILRESLEIG